MLTVDGTLVPTRDHTVAERSKNCRYSMNHQVVIDADARMVVVVGQPLAGDRNDCKVWEVLDVPSRLPLEPIRQCHSEQRSPDSDRS